MRNMNYAILPVFKMSWECKATPYSYKCGIYAVRGIKIAIQFHDPAALFWSLTPVIGYISL